MVRKSPSPTQWETACRWCGVISEHVIAPGRGIHHAELRCESCNTHLRWLSAKNPEERQRLAKQYREQYAMQQQPTAKQLAYLRHLGHCGELPQSMLVASQLIAKLLQEGDGE